MINNCSHQKVGYLLERSDIKEVCDLCYDIDCIESHKFVQKVELSDFISKTLPLLTKFSQILFDQLPNAISSLTQQLGSIYERLIFESPKKQIHSMIEILQNKDDKYFAQLLDFYITRNHIQLIKEKLNEVCNVYNMVKKCQDQFQPNQSDTLEIQDQKSKNKFEKIRILFSKKDESLIQQLPLIDLNSKNIELTQNFEIPTNFKFKRLYSITWLNDKFIGIAAGEFHPFIIYDPIKKYVHQQIVEMKNGVYDSIVVNSTQIVLAYVRNLKLFDFVNGKFVANLLEFQESQSTPSKLYYCKQSNSVFASNNFNQLSPVNYINRWKLDNGQLIKYEIQAKTYGPLCIINDKQQFCSSLWWDKNKKSQRNNYIFIWKYDKSEPIKQINTKEPQYAMNIIDNEIIGFGTEITFWNLQNFRQTKKIKFPEDRLNPWNSCVIDEMIILGCENGNIWVTNKGFDKWEKLMKMRAKTMKIHEYNGKLVITALDCSFCIFQIKN
ncbi:unnamed protein product (macronuclear) [Paramecium tetraurelia]|uniref:TLDc domain-containing protein n=1 Tax=Paramecium tetraurelia TaxID=5888 RepID=A0DF04_PARTE|nr:uncharacterized protein GSPATT00016447001 [Paramecium tetraurelia]CAK81621.1 unnamed protein product [Paramecium tetraurelia]|eukprot:XP_001449018.1 hypothetical protein (macronuclear) [Paramecium tetraurelia strain d4-2]